jgi:ribosomal protein S28E/S33
MSSTPGCEIYSLVLLELHAALINFEKALGCFALFCVATLQFCLVEGSDNLIDVIKHGYINLTTSSIIQVHTEILVYLASLHRHCAGPVPEDNIILLLEVLNHAIHDLSFEMAKLLVMDMEESSQLITFNFLVGHAWIVCVDHEVNVCQNLDKLLIL